ncbi:MAG TPA: uracil-DNA glycosylase [Deltaproteobacteria bacterium]|nr:uracil-DNA glycosylase [Deltaproteobacteria bacterium]
MRAPDPLAQILREEALWAGDFLVMPPRTAAEPVSSGLEGIREKLGDCRRCGLCATRKHIVFGEGNPNARIMFIGEAPGAVEDETGRPFVGPAGRLLTDIIEKAMGLSRSEVYIANILKCRPPGNRDPQPEEVEQCIDVLKQQVMEIRPEVIIALGRIAAHTLLATSTPISSLRGTFREYLGIPLMPTFHPSYLLQNPSKKRETWEDIKKVMAYVGLPLPR